VRSCIKPSLLKSHHHTQRTKRELQVWQSLEHMNIVPLYGIVDGRHFRFSPAMVSPWMDNGTLTDYMKENHTTMTMEVRFRIVRAITLILCTTWPQSWERIAIQCHSRAVILRVLTPLFHVTILNSSAVHISDVVHGDLTGVRFKYFSTLSADYGNSQMF
jgi:serine/threonine protein kinase